MAEAPVKRRYDIINGVRVFVAPPSIRHQDILGNVLSRLGDYADQHNAIALYAPFDVLIARSPFRTRQADVLLISECHCQQHGADDGRPLTVPPEIVVEVLSSPDRELSIEAKLRDYGDIGVQECWIVSPELRQVGVADITDSQLEISAFHASGQSVQSRTFDGLIVAVDDVFTCEMCR